MSDQVQVTIVGNMCDDAEVRFTPSGQAVANFRVASTRRYRDNATGEFTDGDTVFLPVVVWGEMGENCADNPGLKRGKKVIVQGRLQQRSYETPEGEKRTVVEIVADEVGVAVPRGRKK